MALRLHHLWLNDTYHTVFCRMRNGIASWAKAIAIMESNVCALRRVLFRHQIGQELYLQVCGHSFIQPPRGVLTKVGSATHKRDHRPLVAAPNSQVIIPYSKEFRVFQCMQGRRMA
jgi:hypothetical protein